MHGAKKTALPESPGTVNIYDSVSHIPLSADRGYPGEDPARSQRKDELIA